MSRTVLFFAAAVAALVCIAVAAPTFEDEALVRMPRAAQRQMMRGYVGFRRRNGYPMTFAHGYAGARTQEAPAYAPMPDEDEEQEEPKPQEPQAVEAEEEEEDEPLPPVAPSKRPSRARPVRPARPAKRPTTTAAPAASEEAEEDYDEPAPTKGKKKNNGGATAIATAVSRGDGASALSNAVAYGGTFSGGVFRHRYMRGN